MKLTEARDQALDAMREGVNTGVMATILEAVPHQHDSLMLRMVDGNEFIMRVTNIKEQQDLDSGPRPLPEHMHGTIIVEPQEYRDAGGVYTTHEPCGKARSERAHVIICLARKGHVGRHSWED